MYKAARHRTSWYQQSWTVLDPGKLGWWRGIAHLLAFPFSPRTAYLEDFHPVEMQD